MSSNKLDKPVRFGVIGAGWVATARYLPVLLRDKRVEIVAIADQRRAAEVAQRFRIPYHVGSMEELLKFNLDAVAVCTPPWQHAPLTIQAINSGLHVLVEKPMAMTVAEGEEMVRAAQAHGVRLSVAHSSAALAVAFQRGITSCPEGFSMMSHRICFTCFDTFLARRKWAILDWRQMTVQGALDRGK